MAGGLSLQPAARRFHPHNDLAPAATISAAADAQLRSERITFFETRAAADPIDFVSLNILASEYLQRARETGDVADYNRAEYAANSFARAHPG